MASDSTFLRLKPQITLSRTSILCSSNFKCRLLIILYISDFLTHTLLPADIGKLNEQINKTFANAYHRHIECIWKAPVRLLTRSSTPELCNPVPETNTISVLKGILAETCIELHNFKRKQMIMKNSRMEGVYQLIY